MSSLVIFINITGAKLNAINFFGNNIKLDNPESLPIFMMVVLAYFLIRYSQYLHDVEDKGFKKRFYRYVEKCLEGYILKREYNIDKSYLKDNYPDIKEIEYTEPLSIFDESIRPNTAYASFVGKEGGLVVELNELHISNKEFIYPYIRSALYIVFRTRLVTDYVFPFVLFLLAGMSYSNNILCWLQLKP